MLARRDVDAYALGVVDHDPIRPEVHPIGVGVLEHVDDAGPDVAAPVERVPLRRWELEHVDVVAAHHVLHHRAVLHDPGRESSALLGQL